MRRTQFPCRFRGCAALVRTPGYCDRHASESVGWRPDRERGSRHERGYGTDWDRLRVLILKRDHYLCQCDECKRTGRVLPAAEVDHIIPKTEGGSNDPINLICDQRGLPQTQDSQGKRLGAGQGEAIVDPLPRRGSFPSGPPRRS